MVATVTLLVTDIVGSSRLWAEFESAMRADLDAHDVLVGETVGECGGRVFKHTGDGALSVFEDPLAAVSAASELQRRIGAQEWRVPGGLRVRIALHSGVVYARGSDLFGASVNRACRLLAECPAGGVLVSDATAVLLTDRVVEGVALADVGEVLLRGLRQPSRVYSLAAEHLAEVRLDPSAESSTRAARVPVLDGDLVGRDAELAGIFEVLDRSGLVSLVGVGGMGKTRLALEVATRIAGDLGDVWWVDLAAVTSGELMPSVVLGALGAMQQPGREVSESVVEFLAVGGGLVVFDNCEHVLNAARELVQRIRAGAPKAKVLATSREALGLKGEAVVSVSSLLRDDAVALFCERAIEARPDLDLGDTALRAATEICARLDDIPLAVELAAARCRSMAPTEIAARLDDRFRLLRSGRGAERHRTLAATIAWSYDPLDEDERDVFDRMSVFAGGALLDALAYLCDRDEYDVLDIIDRLIARSLVVATDTPLGTRYHQLETLRQYGEDRLTEHGIITSVRDAHLRWLRDFAQRARRSVLTAGAAHEFAHYLAELANLRAAVAHALATGQRDLVVETFSLLTAQAISHPTYELLDWYDPIPTDGEWSKDQATNTALWALLAMYSGDAATSQQYLGAIPPQFSNASMVAVVTSMRASMFDLDFNAAQATLDHIEIDDSVDTALKISLTVLLGGIRLFTLKVDDPAEVDAIVQLAHDHTEFIRATEDTLTFTNVLASYANTLNGAGRHADGLSAATQAAQLAAELGTEASRTFAESCRTDALGLLAPTRPDDHVAIAREMRAMILDHQERRHRFALSADTVSATILIWLHDPRRAILLSNSGPFPTSLLDPDAVAAAFTPEELADIQREGAALAPDAITALTLDALDQIIAS